ncbi:MAG: DUF3552 domain-containing protein, partial [Proteobacteria bacterium]|nr:DUF3552 domain-containing protein [Pseudomonadota bacterium]
MKIYLIAIGIGMFAIGYAVAYWVKGKMTSQKIKAAENGASRIIEAATIKSEAVIKEAQIEAKDKLFKMKTEFDLETKETRAELKKREKRLIQKEESIDNKLEQMERKDKEIIRKEAILKKREDNIENSEIKYNEIIEEQNKQLEKISGLTSEQAKELLLRAMENEAR